MTTDTANLLSAYGLTPTLMNSFGLTGTNAVSFFGEAAVQAFVQDELGVDDSFFFSYNAGDLFDSLVDAQAAVDNDFTGALDIATALNTALQENTGATLDDVNVSFDADGNITTSIDGVGSGSVNLNDLLDQVEAETGIDTSVTDLFF